MSKNEISLCATCRHLMVTTLFFPPKTKGDIPMDGKKTNVKCEKNENAFNRAALGHFADVNGKADVPFVTNCNRWEIS